MGKQGRLHCWEKMTDSALFTEMALNVSPLEMAAVDDFETFLSGSDRPGPHNKMGIDGEHDSAWIGCETV